MATASQQPMYEAKVDEKKDEKRCVTCGHTEDSHEKPAYPHTLKCLDAGCVCGSFVVGTAGSVPAVKKEEEEQAAAKKKEEAAEKLKKEAEEAAKEAKAK